MSINAEEYTTLIFDCDGVLLDSNRVKTAAFYHAALPYGEQAASKFVDYHVTHGGISRYEKFAYFLERLVPEFAERADGPDLDELLATYAHQAHQGLLTCAVADGLPALRQQTSHARWLIASGGDQKELRSVFAERGLASLFDGGIFGSPDNKDTILAREMASSNIISPALFLGDSKYDYQAASSAGLDFVFLTDWSEVKDHQAWCNQHAIATCRNIAELVAG